MSDALRRTVCGRDCNTGTPDANGLIWTVEAVEGWDAPDQSTQAGNLTGKHGSSVTQKYAQGRQLVVRGLIMAPTQDAAWTAYNDQVVSNMPGILGRGDIVTYEPVPKVITVEQFGPPRITVPAGGVMRYMLTLLARYPWKVATTAVTVTVGAGATVSHTAAGSFAAEVEVTLTSGGTVDLSIGGQRLRTGSLPSGAVLTSGPGFSRPKRTIRSSAGGNLFGLIVQPMQWPALVPGANSLHQAGTAALSVRYFPTYA